MQADEVRFLFAYDRWATQRVLTAFDGVGPAVYGRARTSLASGVSVPSSSTISARRSAGATDYRTPASPPEPELEPLPTIDDLRERWEAEWAAVDAWLPTVTDGFVGYLHEACPCGRCSCTS